MKYYFSRGRAHLKYFKLIEVLFCVSLEVLQL